MQVALIFKLEDAAGETDVAQEEEEEEEEEGEEEDGDVGHSAQ